MTDEKNPRTELMDRIIAEWMRACGERDWYQAELTRANQKIRDMLVHADELEKIVRTTEKRAAERDQLAVELGIMRTKEKEALHWLWSVRDAATGHAAVANGHETEEQQGTCALEAIAELRARANRAAINDDELLVRSVDEFEWSVRTANCLQQMGLVLVGDLVQKTQHELLRTKSFGRKSLTEVKEALAALGLELGTPIPDWKERIERWKQLAQQKHSKELQQ